MERIAVFLPILCGFLNVHWTSACSSDIDCSAPERCDIVNNLCTTACTYTTECHHGYICYNGHCIWDEDSEESGVNITTLIAVIVGLGAFLFLVCCCIKHKRRSSNAFTNRATRGTTPRQNGEVNRLQTSSHLQVEEESGNQIPDPIAEGGPPPYNEVSAQPESPPPSYEEVMNVSHEIVPPNVHEHQVWSRWLNNTMCESVPKVDMAPTLSTTTTTFMSIWHFWKVIRCRTRM